VKVSFKYNEELKNYIKSVGGKWDPDTKMWDVPDEAYDDVRYKAMDLGVALGTAVTAPAGKGGAAPTPTPAPASASASAATIKPQQPRPAGQRNQGTIWLGRSKDGRYMIMRINLVAFAEDVQAVLDGTKKGARFRVMMPRPRQTQ
jgi:hypothetical protein